MDIMQARPHSHTRYGDTPATATLFEQAARVNDGWTDPASGLRVLTLMTPARAAALGITETRTMRTLYHQTVPFFDGGRKVILRSAYRKGEPGIRRLFVLDLPTGEITTPFTPQWTPRCFHDEAGTALVYRNIPEGGIEWLLWDTRADCALASFSRPDWGGGEAHLLADGRHVVIGFHRGKPYDEPVHSQVHLVDADGRAELLIDAEGYLCNHLQGNPADPAIFAYDRWPCPKRRAEQVIHVADIHGTFHEPLPLADNSVRPGNIWGGQRDHYLWTPDGRRIASYVSPIDMPSSGDHFDYQWWLSVTDWRTGEDLCVPYPPERWGCNFAVSPDARYVVSAGGRQFPYLYLVDIDGLRQGWNELPLCRYPESVEDGFNRGPFHMPHVLPDQSGVIFSAGWPDDQDGVYLVEWPAALR